MVTTQPVDNVEPNYIEPVYKSNAFILNIHLGKLDYKSLPVMIAFHFVFAVHNMRTVVYVWHWTGMKID